MYGSILSYQFLVATSTYKDLVKILNVKHPKYRKEDVIANIRQQIRKWRDILP